ncbi:beta-xylanase [Paenibacillus baekrokdamisoli]|uniref:Beta-xylanase n=1 Tax=Paenibacillus baekrokdamisoli TaxID=1712516 RepID=A0A3G9IWU2_9BACL|nr:endo-1,4-beta-xylanase [Paenibacillus baekrokdamisoli]MBB3067966.1 endo-1,4-beta-xylanase [Paenibacillus baekrokdamisoli]BBH22986.1 beta-xylanase [Paenibacillus baekrokdamisoli]
MKIIIRKHFWKATILSLLALNLFFKTSFLDIVSDFADDLSNRVHNMSTSGLRDAAAAKGKHIGVATQSWYLTDSKYSSLLSNEFDIITPEYQMKMSEIQDQRGVFDFTEADKIVDFAKRKNILVRGHALIWHDALPSWVVNGNFSKTEWIQILKDHITTTVSHFKGKIYAWDVVNEAFWTNGDYRPSIWYTNIGPQYIEMAFKFAHDADPSAKLFYNDFDTEVTNAKSNAMYQMIKSLKSKGIPIDGVGFQTHLTTDGVNYNDMTNNFQRFAKLGLDTDITEMDVISHVFKGSFEAKMKATADVYSNVYKIALSLPSCKVFMTWGLKDDHSWLNEDTGFQEYPLLFDNSYNKKPAYTAMESLLKK